MVLWESSTLNAIQESCIERVERKYSNFTAAKCSSNRTQNEVEALHFILRRKKSIQELSTEIFERKHSNLTAAKCSSNRTQNDVEALQFIHRMIKWIQYLCIERVEYAKRNSRILYWTSPTKVFEFYCCKMQFKWNADLNRDDSVNLQNANCCEMRFKSNADLNRHDSVNLQNASNRTQNEVEALQFILRMKKSIQ